MRRVLLAGLACLGLAGCGMGSWFGEKEAPPLPGKRQAVLDVGTALRPDTRASQVEVLLPPPEAARDWAQAGGTAGHAMHHLELAGGMKRAWSTGIGSGRDARSRLLSQPVVAGGRVFAIDADSTVSALDTRNGGTLWRVDLTPEDDKGGVGGGLAYDDGRVFATTGYGEVVALQADSGAVLWRKRVGAPVRGAPTARAGRVLAVSVDNQTHALAADDGRTLWTHQGIAELASMLGGSSPAIDGNTVIVPYTTGEIYALRIENGALLWSDSLAGIRRTEAMAVLSDIHGLPVIDRGRVYAAGNSQIMAAIDLRSGRRVWDRQIGSSQTPWIAGDFLFVVTSDNELIAVEAKSGGIKWVTPLQRWVDDEDRGEPVVWTGPILASDRLIIASSHGWALSVSPYTGQVLGREQMPDGVTVAPVAADGTLYFLTDDGSLVAYR